MNYYDWQLTASQICVIRCGLQGFLLVLVEALEASHMMCCITVLSVYSGLEGVLVSDTQMALPTVTL